MTRSDDAAARAWGEAAWHESGHAVACVVLGLPLFDARVWWEPARQRGRSGWKALGRVRQDAEGGGCWDDAGGASSTIVAVLAGPEAEARWLADEAGLPLRKVRAGLRRTRRDGDYQDAAEYLRYATLTIAEAEEQAAALVREHWTAVNSVAGLLWPGEAVPAARIRAAVAAADPAVQRSSAA